MIQFKKIIFIIFVVVVCDSCASSMTPIQVNNTLPTLTKSKFLTQSQADEAINSKKCKYLSRGKKYTAPIGLTVQDDLKNGAKGIDEWVQVDGANAYVLTSYNWVTVDHNGTTQLYLEFDTLLCE